MVFNIKHFFVDSENVNDNWLMLLDMSSEDDRITVFYTKNSPRMSYTSVIKLVENNRNIEFEECFEGSNALDFQLVSYLGYVMQTETAEASGNAEFVIMSNDTGFDPVVSFWKKKGFSVIRINVNYCKMALQRQKSSSATATGKSRTRNKPAVSSDSPFLDDLSAIPPVLAEETSSPEIAEGTPMIAAVEMPEVSIDSLSEQEAEAEAQTAQEGATELSSSTGSSAEVLCESRSPVDSVSDALPAEDADCSATSLTPFETAASTKLVAAVDAVSAIEITPAASVPAEITSEQQNSSHGERKSRSRSRRKSAAAKAAAQAQAATSQPQAVATQAQAKQAQSAPQPQNKADYQFNKDEVDTLINCLGRDNLTLIHETLVHVYGQKPGQTIYKTVKEKNYPFTSMTYSRTDKVKHFSDIIFSHADVQDPGSFVDFLESNKDNSKNLNKVRAAITKTYGEGDGIKCYNLFKPYFKIISALK